MAALEDAKEKWAAKHPETGKKSGKDAPKLSRQGSRLILAAKQ